MLDRIEITIPGKPVAKGRPKFRSCGKFVQTYTPKETQNFENLVKLTYSVEYGNEMLEDGMYLARIISYFPIPKSTSKKQMQLMIDKITRPVVKPDCDNLAKSILDGLNGIAYRDDSCIVSLMVEKYYSQTPSTYVEIMKI